MDCAQRTYFFTPDHKGAKYLLQNLSNLMERWVVPRAGQVQSASEFETGMVFHIPAGRCLLAYCSCLDLRLPYLSSQSLLPPW